MNTRHMGSLMIFAFLAHIADARDVTGHLELLGNPIRTYYAKPEEKSGIYDLHHLDGRIYLAHGSSNTQLPCNVIFYDTRKQSFDLERDPSGKPIEIKEEEISRIREFDQELYFTSADPNGGNSKFIRRNRDGTWIIRHNIAPDAHNRDIYKFKGVLFMHHGLVAAKPPKILISTDDGRSWSVPPQPGFTPHSSYMEMFEFQGALYATGISNDDPWMIKYTGDPTQPWKPVYKRAREMLPKESRNFMISRATVVGNVLLFTAGRPYAAASIEPPRGEELVVPEGMVMDICERQGIAYLLTVGKNRTAVHVTPDGRRIQELFSFQSDGNYNCFEIVQGDFYFAGRGGQWARIRAVAAQIDQLQQHAVRARFGAQ